MLVTILYILSHNQRLSKWFPEQSQKKHLKNEKNATGMNYYLQFSIISIQKTTTGNVFIYKL